MGWYVSDHRGRVLYSHGGNIDGMSAQVAFMPEERIGVVVLRYTRAFEGPLEHWQGDVFRAVWRPGVNRFVTFAMDGAGHVASVTIEGIGASGRVPARQPAPATPMTPLAPHEKLSFLLGTWTMAGFSAAANMRETCDWLGAGRRHIVCHSRWQAASGPREGLSMFLPRV